MNPLIVTEEAYPYLVAQRGALDDMRADPSLWASRYADVINAEFLRMRPHLPARCSRILDVGSGLGGIDILLNRHYGGECDITLLDGVSDPPEVDLHRKTFNSMAVAEEFLRLNGVRNFSYIDANDAHRICNGEKDLIISCKSWCFHYAPEKYLDLAASACHAETVIFIDLRYGKAAWRQELEREFRFDQKIYDGLKFDTWKLCPL